MKNAGREPEAAIEERARGSAQWPAFPIDEEYDAPDGKLSHTIPKFGPPGAIGPSGGNCAN